MPDVAGLGVIAMDSTIGADGGVVGADDPAPPHALIADKRVGASKTRNCAMR